MTAERANPDPSLQVEMKRLVGFIHTSKGRLFKTEKKILAKKKKIIVKTCRKLRFSFCVHGILISASPVGSIL